MPIVISTSRKYIHWCTPGEDRAAPSKEKNKPNAAYASFGVRTDIEGSFANQSAANTTRETGTTSFPKPVTVPLHSGSSRPPIPPAG